MGSKSRYEVAAKPVRAQEKRVFTPDPTATIDMPNRVEGVTVPASGQLKTREEILRDRETARRSAEGAKGLVKLATAVGSAIPIPIVRYPSMAINTWMGATDVVDDLREGNLGKAGLDAVTAIPIPYVSRAGLGPLTARQLSSLRKFNAAGQGLNVVGAVEDMGGTMGQGIEDEGNKKFGGNIKNTNMKKNSKKPCYGCGGKMMEHGGPHNPPGMYWNGERYVEAKGSGTYNNGVYFGQGGPTDFEGYYPPKQQPGYWKVVSPWDSGVLGNVQYGGYITPSMDYQPQILKETNGQRHMGMGGNYIPVSINTPMNYGGYTQAPSDEMEQGGYIPASINYHPEILKMTNGQRHMEQGGYYQTHNLWEDQGHIAELQDGGMTEDIDVPGAPIYRKGGNWIQGAVNPAHKGYCTPMTKKTCTPRRKAFAKTMKKHHGFHEYGGSVQYQNGGFGPDAGSPTADEAAGANDLYTPQAGPARVYDPTGLNPANYAANTYGNAAATTGVVQTPSMPVSAEESAQIAADIANREPKTNKLTGRQKVGQYAQGFNNLLGAGLMAGAAYAQNRSNLAERNRNIDRHGSWNMAAQNQPGGHGNYNQYGNFRPNEQTYSNTGMFLPGGTGMAMSQYGGPVQYQDGGEYDLDDKEIARLKKLGYKIEHL